MQKRKEKEKMNRVEMLELMNSSATPEEWKEIKKRFLIIST